MACPRSRTTRARTSASGSTAAASTVTDRGQAGARLNSGLAYGGNKVRLEYLVADALATGCDTLVSAAASSHHTRQVSGVAASQGLGCVLVQEHWVEWPDVIDRPATSS